MHIQVYLFLNRKLLQIKINPVFFLHKSEHKSFFLLYYLDTIVSFFVSQFTLNKLFQIKTEIISLTACDFDHWGLDCNMSCDCTHHSLYCNNVIGCVCKPGWVGRYCELDNNECKDSGLCQSPEVCTNTLGSYRCDCENGYQRNKTSGLCECKLILSN